MPIKYKGVGGTNFTSTYPINVKRKVSSEECVPLKIDYAGKKEAVVEEGTVWEPDYLKFNTTGRQTVWMDWMYGLKKESTEARLEYSYDRLNWTHFPHSSAGALEFGDLADDPKHKTLFVRAEMIPGQTTRDWIIPNYDNNRLHFCFGQPVVEDPAEVTKYPDVALSNVIATCTLAFDSAASKSDSYFIPADSSITKVSSSVCCSNNKYIAAICYVKAGNVITRVVQESTTNEGVYYHEIDFQDGEIGLFISGQKNTFRFWYPDYEVKNGVVVSGSLSSLADGSGNANWAQGRFPTDHRKYHFSSLFRYYDIESVESYPALLDVSGLTIPWEHITQMQYNSDTSLFNYMFSGCTHLEHGITEIPIQELCQSMYQGMYSLCPSLLTATNFTNITASKGNIDAFDSIYSYCVSLSSPGTISYASTLAMNERMFLNAFYGCTSLTETLEFPTDTSHGAAGANLFQNCYRDCKSLTIVHPFPKFDSFGNYCFNGAFQNCTSLTTLPETLIQPFSATTINPQVFNYTFGGSGLVTIPDTTFSALNGKIIGNSAFAQCFYNCTSLESAPALTLNNFTTSSTSGLKEMFRGCTSMTDSSKLRLYFGDTATNCYQSMFNGCTSLTNLPTFVDPGDVELSEVWLTSTRGHLCDSMFYNCTSLTDASIFNFDIQTTAGESCHDSMFQNCTSLLTGPTTLKVTTTNHITNSSKGAYSKMFYNCISMTVCGSNGFEITYNATDPSCYHSGAFREMFYNCKSLVKGPDKLDIRVGVGCVSSYLCFSMFENCTAMESIGTSDPESFRFVIHCISIDLSNAAFNNCTSLVSGPHILDISGDSIYEQTNSTHSACGYMFKDCTSLTSAGDVIGKISYHQESKYHAGVFREMFSGCTNLVTIPEIDSSSTSEAGSVAHYCKMFFNCKSLVDASNISIKCERACDNTMNSMFQNCTSLVSGPKSIEVSGPNNKVTKETYGACGYMFKNCTSLTEVGTEKLLIDTTEHTDTANYHVGICKEMFYGCTSITHIPGTFKFNSVVTVMAKDMFSGCTALEKIDHFSIDIPSDGVFYTGSNNAYTCTFYNCVSLKECDLHIDIQQPSFGTGSSHFCQMFYKCYLLPIDGNSIILNTETLCDNCYQMMFQDAANLNGAPRLPAKKATASCYEQMFFNAGNPDYGGTRITEAWVGLDASGASASNATKSMFAHYQGSPVQFHVPAGNPYGWIADSTAIEPPNEHLHTSFTIIDDL